MAGQFESYLAWDLYKATFSETDQDGFLVVQPDHYGEKNGGGPPGEVHFPFGFWSNPLDPDVDSAGNVGEGCNAFIAWEGSEPHVLLGSDPRVTPLLPNRVKGESGIYGAKGNFVRCQVDGAVTMYTTADATTAGQVIYRRAAPNGFADVAPWGRQTFDANGWRVVTASGARFVMGGIGGLSAPLGAIDSYAKLSAATVRIQGTVITLGPATGVSDAVAKATPALTSLDAIQAALTAVSALLAAMQAAIVAVPAGTTPAPGPGPGALAAAITAATALLGPAQVAVAGAATAIGAAHGTLPSSSTTVV